MLDSNVSRLLFLVAGLMLAAMVLIYMFGADPIGSDASGSEGFVDNLSSEMVEASQQRSHKY